MRQLGNKVGARNLAISVGVPVMPATDPLPYDDEEIKRQAAEIGYLVGQSANSPIVQRKLQPAVIVNASYSF